jgi:aspartate kinase
MSIVVQKYGGSSVADVEKIRAVAHRIEAKVKEGHQMVVVVSAMGNTTSELIHLAHQVSPNPDRRELDMLISTGERIAMALLAMALVDLGIAAQSLTGSQSGIITDESHSDAKVLEVRPDRVRSVLERGQVAIVAGFQGVSRSREVTTLGRGGSDTTAVVLAAALEAEYCEICSDVDGVWSADPRIVSGAEKLDVLSLESALSLARGGAKVLFEDAVRFARDNGVEIQAARTFGPGSGTRLTVDSEVQSEAVAVAGDGQLVRLEGAAWQTEKCLLEITGLGGRFRRQVGDSIYVDVRNVHGDLWTVPPGASISRDLALVTAVSPGLGEQMLRVAEWTSRLLGSGIDVRRHGAAGDTAWWEIAEGNLDEALNVVHAAAQN